MGRSDSNERHKSPRRTDRRQNALRPVQRALRIRRNQRRRGLACVVRPNARIVQVDLPPRRRAFHQVRRRRTERNISPIRSDHRVVAVRIPGSAIRRNGNHPRIHAASARNTHARILQQNLVHLVLLRAIHDVAPVLADRRRLFRNRRGCRRPAANHKRERVAVSASD